MRARPLGTADAYKILGRLMGDRGGFATGMSLLEQSLALFREYDNPLGEAETIREIGELERAHGEIETGNATLRQAIDIFERIGARGEIDRTRAIIQDS